MNMVKTLYDIYLLGEKQNCIIHLEINTATETIRYSVHNKSGLWYGKIKTITDEPFFEVMNDMGLLYRIIEGEIEKCKMEAVV